MHAFPWFSVLQLFIFVFLIITLMVCFFKPDFLCLTVCAVTAYYIMDTGKAEQHWIRMQFFGLVLSFILDVIWLILMLQPWWGHEHYDGDLEKRIRRYSIVMVFISLFWRIFLIPVYWKISVDFGRLFKGRGD